MAEIPIGGRLHSTATGNVVAGANEILDDTINKKQSEINVETYRLVENINESLENLNPEQTEALSVAEKANSNEVKLSYFECETESNVAAKIIANATGYILSKGGSIKIKMINTNTASNVTLNINSTGAKTLYYNSELASSTNTWKNNEIIEVYFDGNNYYANIVSSDVRFSTGEKVKNVGIDDEPTAGSENLVKSGGVADIIYNKGKFVNDKGGIKELYFLDDTFVPYDLHLLYRTQDTSQLRFFNDQNELIAQTKVFAKDYDGIIPIYDSSTLGGADVIVGYVIVYWEYWKEGTNVVSGQLTTNVRDISCSPSIYAYLNSKDISSEIERATQAETILRTDINAIPSTIDTKITNNVYGIIVNHHIAEESSPNRADNLSIPSGKNIKIVIDNGIREFAYYNILVIEDGSTKKLNETALTAKYYTFDYLSQGTITSVIVSYNTVTTNGNTFLSVYDSDAVALPERTMYVDYLRKGKLSFGNSPIAPSMFDDTTLLANTLNSAFENYAILCKCSKYSFYPFNLNDIAQGRFVFKVNHNFRKIVIADGMTADEMAALINYQFTQPINRFNDAILNTIDGINASINTQMRVGEPSAIVSDDMQTLYVYCSSLYRYKSIDGINYVLDHNITIDGVQVTQDNPEYLMHVNVNYIDGVYYLIGTHGNHQPLVLWTSHDGWNFTKVGTLLEIGDTINSGGETIGNFGNTFLHKDAGTGKWYLYYEIAKSVGAVGWEICIATCPDITAERESGKYGVWTQYADNPAFPAGLDTYTSRTTGKGNPNIVCGLNNRPLKYNGKYYIYIHGNTSWGGVAIMRYYSTDLIHWTYDGIVYNNRDVPTAGETAPGNGDHCIVEFKGRTLLFYTWDINDYPRPEYVKLTIDDRPILELLSIMV